MFIGPHAELAAMITVGILCGGMVAGLIWLWRMGHHFRD